MLGSRRNSRAIAGLNVSELNAEKTNEKTIVIANWLYSLPVSPGMNATGTNTAASTRVIVTIGVVISAIAARVASSGCRPRSRYFSTFSTTMIASSTTRPIASTSPQSVSVLIEKPKAAISANVATSETGIAIIGMIVARNALEEHEHDDHHQHERLDQRVLDLVDVLARRTWSCCRRSCIRGRPGSSSRAGPSRRGPAATMSRALASEYW